MTKLDTDRDLAQAAAAGNSDAFDELYRRHADAAWRVAYAVTGNRDDAADTVAEAFTRILTSLSAGRTGELDGFRAYLLTATRNAGIDVLRRSGRLQPLGDDAAEKGRPSAAGPSDRLMEGVDAALVASAFRSLPERWRSVLWLTEVEGMAPAEAATLLGVSANGAAQLAVRARAGLRQRFLQAHLRSDVPSQCRYTVDRLGAYVGGGLAPRDIAKVDQHLAGCPECRDRLSELEDLGSRLRKVSAALPLTLGALVWEHWRRSAHAETHRRALTPLFTQRGLMGASLGILAIGIIGASILGQPAIGSVGRPRSAAPAPVGQKPVALQEVAAASAPLAGSLPLAAPGLSPAGTSASGAGPAAGPGPSASGGTGSAGAGAGAGTGSPAPGSSSPLPGLSGVIPSSSGSPTLQLGGSINLSPAPVGVAVNAGTQSTGAGVSSPATGSTGGAVTGTAPTAPTTTSTGTPTATVTATSPLGTQTATFPSTTTSTTSTTSVTSLLP